MIGITKFKTAYGAYCRVGTPSVPKINTPHVFQGTKTEVSVPPSLLMHVKGSSNGAPFPYMHLHTFEKE